MAEQTQLKERPNQFPYYELYWATVQHTVIYSSA